MSKLEELAKYGPHTIDELIKVLEMYKKEVGGDTEVHLSDTEFNGRHRHFELGFVEGESELFLFFEMHEDLWD